jgi:uncharacterized protein
LFLEQNNTRHRKLGLYFEDLWLFWLQWARGSLRIEHDFKIYEKKRTIGAIDFLVQKEPNEYEHWEVAVKFYLGIHESPNWDHWVGPSKKDSLSKKLTRLFRHQIELSNSPTGKVALQEANIPSIVAHRIFLKGIFFQKFGTSTLPLQADPSCQKGIWVEQHQLAQLVRDYPFTYRFAKRNKPDWLSPSILSRSETEDIRELLNFSSNRDLPFMISILRGPHTYMEQSRVFIVPDGWFDTV